MILGFITRTIFIQYLAVEYLGVNSLFTNILSMLSLAELGIGSAFIYELFKPLANADTVTVATIIRFFRKVYAWVGGFIFVSGLVLLPFLDQLIDGTKTKLDYDIHWIYLIFLFNSASTYFFSYKISLLDADQKSAIATFNSMKFMILQNLLQIFILITTQNFILYLIVQSITGLASNFYISRLVNRRYPYLNDHNSHTIKPELRENIIKNAKATFLIRIGGVLVNGTDNIIINYFVGLTLLGIYSNYVLLVSMISGVLIIIFSNIRSSIANVTVTDSLDKQRSVFTSLNFINFWLYGLCFLWIIFCTDPLIQMWIGHKFIMSQKITLLLAINFFMVGMQTSFWTFKSVYGFFEQGKYMVLLTALLNLVLSFVLGYYYGIFGVLLATAIARLVTNFWYDPYIVITQGLKMVPIDYLKRFTKYVFVIILSSFFVNLLHWVRLPIGIIQFITFGIFSFIIFNFLLYLFFRKSEEFHQVMGLFRTAVQFLRVKINR
jgi:O-antigen/teichoic acid export membrane protein